MAEHPCVSSSLSKDGLDKLLLRSLIILVPHYGVSDMSVSVRPPRYIRGLSCSNHSRTIHSIIIKHSNVVKHSSRNSDCNDSDSTFLMCTILQSIATDHGRTSGLGSSNCSPTNLSLIPSTDLSIVLSVRLIYSSGGTEGTLGDIRGQKEERGQTRD